MGEDRSRPRHTRLECLCDAAGWTHSRRLRCLGFEWSVLTNDPGLIDCVTSLYDSNVEDERGPARNVFILRRHTGSDPTSVSIYREDRAITRRSGTDLAIARVAWEVNRGVIEEAENRLLLHAAAAERDGKIVLLAGPEGSGKSTLVAALVCSGFRYVTDETVAVELPGMTIAPYPKPVALDSRSLASLRDLWPGVPQTQDSGSVEQLLPAHAIGRGAVAPPGGIARVLVLLSAYRPGVATAARSIARSEAATILVEQAFNFRELGPGRLDAMAEIVRACDCYRVAVGDLDTTRRLLLELFDAGLTRVR
jgi:hypothetical protein